MALVEAELAARRAAGTYAGKFAGLAHYFGYEGRCALPTNFDATCARAMAVPPARGQVVGYSSSHTLLPRGWCLLLQTFYSICVYLSEQAMTTC